MKKINIKTNLTTKKILIWSGVFLTVGVTGYLVYKGYKKFQEKLAELKAQKDALNETSTQTSTGGGSAGGSSSIPPELNTTAKIKAFQDWCDANNFLIIPPSASNPKWSKLNKGAGYGTFGKNTRKAWNVHREAYLEFLKSGASTVDSQSGTSTSDSKLKTALAVISQKFQGAKDSFALKQNPELVKAWADAILNSKKNAFIWANQIYRISDLTKIYQQNPIGKTAISSKQLFLRKDAKLDTQTFTVQDNNVIGEISSYYYNDGEGILYFYAPNNKIASTYKWLTASSVKLTN